MAGYTINDALQAKIAALLLRDPTFSEITAGLIQPDYFKSKPIASLVSLVLEHFEVYKSPPSLPALAQLVKDALESKRIHPSVIGEVKDAIRQLATEDLSDRSFLIDQVVKFARHRATENAIVESSALLQKGEFDKIETLFADALSVGTVEAHDYDYFDEVDNRATIRQDKASGKIPKTGITTGSMEIDNLLKHAGFGRKELSIYMGPAKSGKSFGLTHCAIAAVISGYNVLYVTLENSTEVATDRIDAALSDVQTNQLHLRPLDVASKITKAKQNGRVGTLKVREFPMESFSPNDMVRLLNHYQQRGIFFDECVVDYLDVMIPNKLNKEPRENSRSVWASMRGIAQKYNLAMVSATQTNRDGFKAGVADATHVAEDINKIRIADLVISINRTEEERRDNKARLFFAASRNQQDSITIDIAQDLSRAKFLTQVISIT